MNIPRASIFLLIPSISGMVSNRGAEAFAPMSHYPPTPCSLFAGNCPASESHLGLLKEDVDQFYKLFDKYNGTRNPSGDGVPVYTEINNAVRNRIDDDIDNLLCIITMLKSGMVLGMHEIGLCEMKADFKTTKEIQGKVSFAKRLDSENSLAFSNL